MLTLHCVGTGHGSANFWGGSTMLCDPEQGFQVTQTRCRGFDPGDGRLEQDICDISMWLVEKYRVPFVHLWIDKHHFQHDYQIACVAVMVWEKHLDHLTAAARHAFLALDYEIRDTGADVYALQCCEGNHSRHDALRAFSRIEAKRGVRGCSSALDSMEIENEENFKKSEKFTS
ncbi:hypothetical protein [Antarcticimicrobium sediminis]|nr:hypothetical protein [Antarcticimicrobium sediminis]